MGLLFCREKEIVVGELRVFPVEAEFQHEAAGIHAHMLQYVPLTDPAKITALILRALLLNRQALILQSVPRSLLMGTTLVLHIMADTALLRAYQRNGWLLCQPA